MSVKICTLDGKNVRSLNDLYDRLAAALPLPGHFGRNLDALWDALSTDIDGPFEIVWKNAGASQEAMGEDFGRVLNVLRDVEEERDDFNLKVEL
jgi:ribonuclease inhibitor